MDIKVDLIDLTSSKRAIKQPITDLSGSMYCEAINPYNPQNLQTTEQEKPELEWQFIPY